MLIRYNLTDASEALKIMIGRTISHYKIVGKLGEGGMGVVYKAEDTQLRRTVALKFLSAETVGNEEVKARLIREAQASASLDHPNICQVFGIHEEQGQTFVAMAHIEGPELADKIKERPLPLDEALGFAIQIAEGLQEAHEKGIVHRDVKPHNVMLTAKGQVKIMDFGLASLSGRSKLTKSGTTLGTPAYMAPEQLEGREVDCRADIWALGCVLYEMLTQRTPFDAEYEQAIAYGILNEAPEPISAQRADVDPNIDRFVSKALAKEPGERYQHASDLAVDLKGLLKGLQSQRSIVSRGAAASQSKVQPAPAVPRFGMAKMAWPLAAVLALALAVSLAWRPEKPASGLITSTIEPPVTEGAVTDLALSPDGRWLAMNLAMDLLDPSSGRELWLRSLADSSARKLDGTEGALYPFWSPDSRSIGFFTESRLNRIDIESGIASLVCDVPDGRGGTWNEDGIILFGSKQGPIQRVAAGGGSAVPATENQDESGEAFTHRWPVFLPDGRRFLFHAGQGGVITDAGRKLYIGSLDSNGLDIVMEPGPGNVALSGGHILWVSDKTLFAQPFDAGAGSLTGEPVALARGVPFVTDLTWTSISFSSDGLGVFFEERAEPGLRRLAKYDRSGKRLETLSVPGALSSPAFAPDGRRLAYFQEETLADLGHPKISIYDLERGVEARFTPPDRTGIGPLWHVNGQDLTWIGSLDDVREYGVFRGPADSSVERVRLGRFPSIGTVTSWSRNGSYLLTHEYLPPKFEAGVRVFSLGPDGDLTLAEEAYLGSASDERQAVFHPNGSWVAYSSDESGSHETYVARFPKPVDKQRVSKNGGAWPQWSEDGREIYYADSEEQLVVTQIEETAEGDLRIGSSQKLFPLPRFVTDERTPVFESSRFAVAPDGESFVAIESMGLEEYALRIVLMQNWEAR